MPISNTYTVRPIKVINNELLFTSLRVLCIFILSGRSITLVNQYYLG